MKAGKRHREETLLLPPQNIPCTNGDASHVDHMPLPIIPIVTNHGQDTPPPNDDDDESPSTDEHNGENLSENEAKMSENNAQENAAENTKSGTESEDDSPATSDFSDLEEDPVFSAARGGQPQTSRVASTPLQVCPRRPHQKSPSRDPPEMNASPTARRSRQQSPLRAPSRPPACHASAILLDADWLGSWPRILC
jgi:hypothetical protein